MNIYDYAREGGFSAELALIRELGQTLTTLENKITERGGSAQEGITFGFTQGGIDELRKAIIYTRDDALHAIKAAASRTTPKLTL